MHPHCLFVVNELLALSFICLSCLRVADAHEHGYVACGDMIEVAEIHIRACLPMRMCTSSQVYELIEHRLLHCWECEPSISAVTTNTLLPLQLTSAMEGCL